MTSRQIGAFDRKDCDSNGWYTVSDNPLSRAGVFPYSEASVVRGGDQNKMVNVLLPPEELASEEAVNSFRLLPWTDDHPSDLLGPKEKGLVPAEQKGIQGVIGEDVYFKDGILYGNIKVFSEDLAKKIASGKRELSCGYRCDFVPEAGVYDGIRYQYVQRNVRGNHTASVSKGRRGPEIRVLDAAENCFTFSLDMSEPFRSATPTQEYDVPIEEIIRDVRRDAAAKERLVRDLSSIRGLGFALDSNDAETAKEFSARMLKSLGRPAAADPVTMLSAYIAGARSGMDSASRSGGLTERFEECRPESFVDRWLKE